MTALLAARPRKPISLTALIDVVFILLMFFMLTSSFTTRHETRLQTATAATESTDTKPLQLALTANGHWLQLPQKNPVDQAWLQTQPGDSSIMVYPQADTQVQTIITQMHQLKQLGFERVNLGDALEP